MKHISWIFRIIGKNWKAFASFEVLFKIITSTAVMPLFRLMFDQSLRLSGMRYLTAENIGTFLRRPLPFICVLLILFLYTILEFFELGVLICLFDHCRHGEHATMGSAVLWSCRSCARLIRDRKNIRILPALLILSPFYHFATIINMFWSYSVSERVLKFIRMRWYRIAYAALLISLLLILFQRWMYLCHYYFLDGNTSSEAFHNSRLLGKKTHSVKSFWPLMQVQVIMTVLYVFFVVILLLMCDLARKLFSLNGAGVSSFQVMCINIGVSAFDAFILIISFACICELFYRGKHKIHEKIPYASLYGKHLSEAGIRRGSRRIERIMYAASILLAVFYVSFVSRRSYSLRVDGLQTMQVTAHRGASMFFPENTMPAFVGAVEQGADWIELDVQESADGQIYVMHDSNFIRTAGLDAFSWETDWNEIRGLDAGAFFSSEFAGTRIPLLSEALEFAKEEGIRLNIEIKPTGHEKDLTAKVVQMIEEMEFKDQCVITSQSYDVVRTVKEMDEEIYTVYVMGLAYGAINRLQAADAFSIRSTSISRSLVRDLHNRGLEVYAWTVDSRRNINRMINFGVDNIITNNVPLAIECINDSKTNSMLMETIKILRDLF